MPASSPLARRQRRAPRVLTATAAVVLAVVALTGPGASSAPSTSAGDHAVPPPPANPTSADQIQNIDQVKTAIKAYYGDTADPSTINPVTGNPDLHTFDPDGAYAAEVKGIAKQTRKLLAQERKPHQDQSIVLDVDDTTLNTYSYEIYSSFVYNPSTNAQFVNAGVFPAVPGMVKLVDKATSLGYTVFFLTGRPESQRAGTEDNLTDEGYQVVDSQLFLKDLNKPIYASCAPSCTTIQYKSLTRQYIEDSYDTDIVADLGDQFSDLKGGFTDHKVKVPNPMYYLP